MEARSSLGGLHKAATLGSHWLTAAPRSPKAPQKRKASWVRVAILLLILLSKSKLKVLYSHLILSQDCECLQQTLLQLSGLLVGRSPVDDSQSFVG